MTLANLKCRRARRHIEFAKWQAKAEAIVKFVMRIVIIAEKTRGSAEMSGYLLREAPVRAQSRLDRVLEKAHHLRCESSRRARCLLIMRAVSTCVVANGWRLRASAAQSDSMASSAAW